MKVSINGKEYGLHWGMPCLAEMCEMMNCTIEECTTYIIGGGEYSAFERQRFSATGILCAMRHYARLHREDVPDVTIHEVMNYCDETPPEKFSLVREDFLNSMLNGRSIAESLGLTIDTGQKKSLSASPKKSSSSTKLATSRGR